MPGIAMSCVGTSKVTTCSSRLGIGLGTMLSWIGVGDGSAVGSGNAVGSSGSGVGSSSGVCIGVGSIVGTAGSIGAGVGSLSVGVGSGCGICVGIGVGSNDGSRDGIGDGKKYNSVEDALKSVPHAQKHIQTDKPIWSFTERKH